MRYLVLAVPCAVFTAISAPLLAQEPSGRIIVEADGVAAEWTIVASPPANTPNENGEPMQSVFAPQSGDFEGVDMLVMWAAPTTGGSELMMLAVYHRVTGEPSFVDQYFKGFLFHYPDGQDGAWVSDFGAPGSEVVVDDYSVSGDLATATGHFTATAYFEPDDADEPDQSRALAISGTFEAQLPQLEER
jgi:hypothetical protein